MPMAFVVKEQVPSFRFKLLVVDSDECADGGVGPQLRGDLERELDAPEALGRPERGAVERVQSLAAVEVADPADSGVVVVRPVGVPTAHAANRYVLEDGPGAERGRCRRDAGVAGRGEDDTAVVPERQEL